MDIERPTQHRRIMDFMIESAWREPVQVGWPTSAAEKNRSDVPFYFGWLPAELTTKILHPDNFVPLPGNLGLPQEMTFAERKEMFRYIDDLLALRLVNRSFSYRYKARACVQSIRWMMHWKPYDADLKWLFAMHCTASMLVTMAPTAEAAGAIAFQHLKTASITRMMVDLPREQVQPTVDEVCANRPSTTPRF